MLRQRLRLLEVRRSALTRARAGLVGQLEHPAADRGPIAHGRRRKGLRKRQPHIGAALEDADLAEGGIGALRAVLPRDDAPHVPARGHAGDLHRERARGVVARELLRGAQLSSLRQLPRHLIEPGALPERHQAAGMPAAIEEARRYVLLEMYLVRSGAVATRFIDALGRAAGRGARVCVMFDGFGALGLTRADRRRLLDAGLELRFFNPLRLGNRL